MDREEQGYGGEDLRRYFQDLIGYFHKSGQLERITQFASGVCKASVSLVNFIDQNHQYTVSSTGEWNHFKLPLDQSFCVHTVSSGGLLIIDKTVPGAGPAPDNPPLPFYAGVAVPNPAGIRFATLCILNPTTLQLSDSQISTLLLLSEQLQLRFEVFAQQKQREEMENNLRQRDTLFHEIHHRIKNNLGDICGILQIQWFETEDPTVRSILSSAEARIIAVIKLHEILYESDDLVYTNLKTYLNRLVHTIREISGKAEKDVTFNLQVDEVHLDMNQSMSVGLIVNELATNAIHHAFPEEVKGDIHIEVRESDQGKVYMMISDNGSGMNLEERGLQEYSNMGLKLVELLTQQLNGSLQVQSGREGTRFELEFNRSYQPLKKKGRKALIS